MFTSRTIIAAGLLALSVIADTASAQAEERANLWVRVKETRLLGDLHLEVRVLPHFDAKPSEITVTLIAERQLDECTYSNSDAIWKGEGYADTSGDLGCVFGATFPIRRIETVTAEVGGTFLREGRPLRCHVAAISKSQPRGLRTYACNYR